MRCHHSPNSQGQLLTSGQGDYRCQLSGLRGSSGALLTISARCWRSLRAADEVFSDGAWEQSIEVSPKQAILRPKSLKAISDDGSDLCCQGNAQPEGIGVPMNCWSLGKVSGGRWLRGCRQVQREAMVLQSDEMDDWIRMPGKLLQKIKSLHSKICLKKANQVRLQWVLDGQLSVEVNGVSVLSLRSRGVYHRISSRAQPSPCSVTSLRAVLHYRWRTSAAVPRQILGTDVRPPANRQVEIQVPQ